MKRLINWRVFFILLGMSIGSIFAIFPYILSLQGDVLRKVPVSLPVLFLIQLLQNSVLFSILIAVGLYLSQKVHFSVPVLEALTKRKKVLPLLKKLAPQAILLGIVAAAAIFLVDHVFTFFGATISTSVNPAPVWERLLAAFYGGITEEIVMRLFLLTLFVWIGLLLTKQRYQNAVIISSIILSSIIFGLGHLPVTAAMTAITPLVVTRAIVLNGIGGVIFGWLYWKKGLESAMISHFTADIFLLTVLPVLFG